MIDPGFEEDRLGRAAALRLAADSEGRGRLLPGWLRYLAFLEREGLGEEDLEVARAVDDDEGRGARFLALTLGALLLLALWALLLAARSGEGSPPPPEPPPAITWFGAQL